MMRGIRILLWGMMALLLASCDPISSVEYNIYNLSGDTVRVDFYKEIMISNYQGYSIVESDSVTTRYTEADSVYVAVLAPKQRLTVLWEWHGLYREERVVPLWRYISSVKMGDTELATSQWADESLWHLNTKGGGHGEGESRYYDLYLCDAL